MLRDIYEIVKHLARKRHAVQISEEMMLYVVGMTLIAVLVTTVETLLGNMNSAISTLSAAGSGTLGSLQSIWNAIVHFTP